VKFRVMPVRGRVGKCRQVGTVEIEVTNTDFGKGRSDKSRYPYHEVERAIDRAFHKYMPSTHAETVVTVTDDDQTPVGAVLIDGDREVGRFVIYPMKEEVNG